MEERTIDSLPIEVFTGHILTLLPVIELTQTVRLVCKKWKEAASIVGVALSFSQLPLEKTACAINVYPYVRSLTIIQPNFKEAKVLLDARQAR